MAELNTKYAKAWVELARWAPSGGNAQPWKVGCEETSNEVAFQLSIDPEYRKKASLMDVKGVASVIALGGFFKSLKIAAANDGFQEKMFRWIESSDFWGSAIEFSFEKQSGAGVSSITNSELRDRNTNRGPFYTDDIPHSLIRSFEKIRKELPDLKVVEIPVGDKNLISILQKLQKIRWQHQGFLMSLIKEIGFDPSDKSYSEKIPLSQLGISKIESLIFKSIGRKPEWAIYLLRMGFYLLPVRKSVLTFANESSRIYFIQAPQFDFKSAFHLGVCLQDLWLHAQAEKISFQPCGDALVALAYWQKSNENLFSSSQVKEIQEASELFKKNFGLDLRFPVMGFRIGFPKVASAAGVRKEVRIESLIGMIRSFIL